MKNTHQKTIKAMRLNSCIFALFCFSGGTAAAHDAAGEAAAEGLDESLVLDGEAGAWPLRQRGGSPADFRRSQSQLGTPVPFVDSLGAWRG